MTPQMLVFASIQTKNELFDKILINFGPQMFTLSIYIRDSPFLAFYSTDERNPQWAIERILNNALLRNATTSIEIYLLAMSTGRPEMRKIKK